MDKANRKRTHGYWVERIKCKDPYLDTEVHWADIFADYYGIARPDHYGDSDGDYEEYYELLHDIRNLRGDEWARDYNIQNADPAVREAFCRNCAKNFPVVKVRFADKETFLEVARDICFLDEESLKGRKKRGYSMVLSYDEIEDLDGSGLRYELSA